MRVTDTDLLAVNDMESSRNATDNVDQVDTASTSGVQKITRKQRAGRRITRSLRNRGVTYQKFSGLPKCPTRIGLFV